MHDCEAIYRHIPHRLRQTTGLQTSGRIRGCCQVRRAFCRRDGALPLKRTRWLTGTAGASRKVRETFTLTAALHTVYAARQYLSEASSISYDVAVRTCTSRLRATLSAEVENVLSRSPRSPSSPQSAFPEALGRTACRLCLHQSCASGTKTGGRLRYRAALPVGRHTRPSLRSAQSGGPWFRRIIVAAATPPSWAKVA